MQSINRFRSNGLGKTIRGAGPKQAVHSGTGRGSKRQGGTEGRWNKPLNGNGLGRFSVSRHFWALHGNRCVCHARGVCVLAYIETQPLSGTEGEPGRRLEGLQRAQGTEGISSVFMAGENLPHRFGDWLAARIRTADPYASCHGKPPRRSGDGLLLRPTGRSVIAFSFPNDDKLTR